MISEKRKVGFNKPGSELGYTKKEKIKILIEGLNSTDSLTEFCLRKGINSNLYFKWSEELAHNGVIEENKLRLDELEARKIKTENEMLVQLVQQLNEQNEKIKANLGITD